MIFILKIGDKAPDFELETTELRKLRLYDELKNGPVMLYFYSGSYGLVCTAAMNIMKDHGEELQDRGIRMLPITSDDLDIQRNWKQRLDSHFEHLSDPNKEVSKSYNAIVIHTTLSYGFVDRMLFLIDIDGTIRYIWSNTAPVAIPEMNKIIEEIDTIPMCRPPRWREIEWF